MWDKLTKAGAAVVGALAGLLGEWNVMLTALAVLMVLDYMSGLLCAWRGVSPKTVTGGVSSKASFDGLAKKAFIILIVLLATILDHVIDMGSAVFQTAATMYYIANEGISILENAAILGVPFPERMKKTLEAVKQKADEEERTKTDKQEDDGNHE